MNECDIAAVLAPSAPEWPDGPDGRQGRGDYNGPMRAATSSLRALRQDAGAAIWLPSAALAGAVRLALVRDTRGRTLDEVERLNVYPACPMCSLSVWLDGHCVETEFGHAAAAFAEPAGRATWSPPSTSRRLPRIAFCGPMTQPSASWAPGAVHGLMFMISTDAVVALTGLDPLVLRNQLMPPEAVLPADWAPLWAALADARDAGGCGRALEGFLGPRWSSLRPATGTSGHYRDWAESLALRAAVSGPGRSLRQVERRIRRWAGLPMRELRGLGRAEQAYFAGLAAYEAGDLQLARLAHDHGYADQSHLSRETRRITGFAPRELSALIPTQEAFWAYRVWQ